MATTASCHTRMAAAGGRGTGAHRSLRRPSLTYSPRAAGQFISSRRNRGRDSGRWGYRRRFRARRRHSRGPAYWISTQLRLSLPKLLLASLVLTPVFYRLSALDGLKGAWCLANPLCVATELARAGISFQAEALPRYAISIACALSGAILCWGLFSLRVPSPTFPDEHA